MASFKKKCDIPFTVRSLNNLSSALLSFVVLDVLESQNSNNRDILLEGTQKLVRVKKMLEL